MSAAIAPPTATSSRSKSKPKDKGKENPSKSKPKKKEKETVKSNTIKSKTLIDDSDLESELNEEAAPEPEAEPSNSLVPPGSTRLTTLLDGDDFDYDTLKENDDLELWVLRVPEGIKPKYLSNINLSIPPPLPTSTSTSSQQLGTLERKNATYDVWSIPSSSSTNTTSFNADKDGDDGEEERDIGNSVGGEELLGLTCLLPRRQKGGKLFVAPKPITHHLILTSQPTLPTPPPSSPEAETNGTGETTREKTGGSIYKSPARYQHPKHLLKHRFIPTRAGTGNHSSSSSSSSSKAGEEIVSEENRIIEVDGQVSTGESKVKATPSKSEKEKKKKKEEKNETGEVDDVTQTPAKKKRKAEGESKKKSKKMKTTAGDGL